MPRLSYPQERPSTHWVGCRAGVDGCRKSSPTRIRSPDHAAHSELLYQLCYPGPLLLLLLLLLLLATLHLYNYIIITDYIVCLVYQVFINLFKSLCVSFPTCFSRNISNTCYSVTDSTHFVHALWYGNSPKIFTGFFYFKI